MTSDLAEALDALFQEIEAADIKRRSKVLHQACQRFEDLTLLDHSMPAAGLSFLQRLLASEQVQASSGIFHFLLEVNVDICKYDEAQKEALLISLVGNAGKLKDQLDRHAVGDLIARAYPTKVAFNALRGLSQGSGTDKHVAFIGFDVLRMSLPKGHAYERKVIAAWRQLLDELG